jgi:5-methylcytosine-specific restriction endonuclease McrA
MLKETSLKEKIIDLRNQNLSYREISEKLNCTKSVICYHLTEKEKQRVADSTKKFKENNPLSTKLTQFTREQAKGLNNKALKFSQDREIRKGLKLHKDGENYINYKNLYEELIKKPYCYLTGESVDLTKSADYQLDHIIPISKNGSSTLDNMGLTTKAANKAKSDLTLEEFFDLCASVIVHNNLMPLVEAKLANKILAK